MSHYCQPAKGQDHTEERKVSLMTRDLYIYIPRVLALLTSSFLSYSKQPNISPKSTVMYHAFFLLALCAHCVTSHPSLYQARQEPSCTAVGTVTVTSIPPAMTVTTSISIYITTTVTGPVIPPTSSTSTVLTSPTPRYLSIPRLR